MDLLANICYMCSWFLRAKSYTATLLSLQQSRRISWTIGYIPTDCMNQLKRMHSDFLVFVFLQFCPAFVLEIGRSPHQSRLSDRTPNIKDNDCIGEVLVMQISWTIGYIPTDCMNQLKRMNSDFLVFVFLPILPSVCS